MKLCFILMGNWRFSYMSDKRFIIDKGYLPLLELFRHYPELRSEILNSSYTTRKYEAEAPSVVEGIRRGVKEKRIGISTNGFEHAFLPTLSVPTQEKLIAKGVEVDRSVYGVQPQGFWASDCCWDSTVIKPLADNGVRWAYIGPWIKSSNPGGPFYNDWKDYDPYLPVWVKGTENSRLAAFPSPYAQYDILLEKNAEQYKRFFAGIRERADKGDGFAFIQMDFEVLAVLKSSMWNREKQVPMEKFIENLLALPKCSFGFASEYLDSHPPEKTVCLREGIPGEYKPWDCGCRKLDTTCRQAEQYLMDVDDILAARPALASKGIRQRVELLWERFLLSMQSEPRMTSHRFMWDDEDGKNRCLDKCVIYPPDEMVLEAINDATAAFRGARQLKRELMAR
jgi:hypothetical protein